MGKKLKVCILVSTPIILAVMLESLISSCANPHSFIKVPQFFRIALRDAESTLLGRRFSELLRPYHIHGNHVTFVQKFY